MKKSILVLLGAMMMCMVNAQVLKHDEPALVYYSPKTVVVVDFTYTVETQEKGLYAEFAKAMLGANDAIMETRSTYTLDDVTIGTKTETDYSRPHKVDAESGIPMLLAINEKGLLSGYNVSASTERRHPCKQKEDSQVSPEQEANTTIAPLPEEILKAGTPEAQAREIAKQIFHIRETRMYLLSGEVEHAPADGKAMQLVLDELDKQESALTELFIGKKSTKTAHKVMNYRHIDIDRTNDATRVNRGGYKYLLYFSEENGFTSAENIEADTIFTKVQLTTVPYFKPIMEEQKDKKKKEPTPSPSQIVYNLPGRGEVEVSFKGKRLASQSVQLAQLGLDVPLPKSLFTGNELPHIEFSEKTGNIISISK